jgi:hypothetical protein
VAVCVRACVRARLCVRSCGWVCVGACVCARVGVHACVRVRACVRIWCLTGKIESSLRCVRDRSRRRRACGSRTASLPLPSSAPPARVRACACVSVGLLFPWTVHAIASTRAAAAAADWSAHSAGPTMAARRTREHEGVLKFRKLCVLIGGSFSAACAVLSVLNAGGRSVCMARGCSSECHGHSRNCTAGGTQGGPAGAVPGG